MTKTKFLYHAEAVGASGRITLPVDELIEIQAATALPMSGGAGTARSENFRHRNILSFDRAESSVVGSYSAKDLAHGTASSVMVEGVNILNVVTCDRLVMRLTSKHDEAGGEASFIIHGSYFENLRIAGHRFDLPLATDLFSEYSTWGKLTDAFQRDDKARKEIGGLSLVEPSGNALPESKGMLGMSLARGLDKLPGGLTRNGQGIYVPHFGTVYLGQFYISPAMRRLTMLHVELGCAVEGCTGLGSGAGNGSSWP
jgi:hypothetical protein